MGNIQLTPHQQVILAYLERGKTLTNKTALMCLGIGSLSSRIAELRKLGFDITKEKEFDERDETHYVKYKLAVPEVPVDESGHTSGFGV